MIIRVQVGTIFLCASLFLLFPFTLWGGGWSVDGQVSFDTRYFTSAPEFTQQKEARVSPSVAFESQLVYESNKHRLTITPFLRFDSNDKNRNHFDFREFNWLYLGSDWDISFGIDKVFWGVTESVHLVDIVNQIDGVEDVNGEDKLGQLMLSFNVEQAWGALNILMLPMFKKRLFNSEKYRLQGPIIVDSEHATYESEQKDYHTDWAARWAKSVGDMDMAVSYFQGTNREPHLLLQTVNKEPFFIPYYNQIKQIGLESLWFHGDTLWKAEGIIRKSKNQKFIALVAGFESTIYRIAETSTDLGVIFEYTYDGRDPLVSQQVVGNNDIFLGARVSVNDAQDTSALFGIMYDYHSYVSVMSLQAETRLNGDIKIKFNSRFLINVSANDPLAVVRKDDFFEVKIISYF